MTVYVDADACPKTIKSILYKAAQRTQIPLVLVANQVLATPPSQVIRTVQVRSGFDQADQWIVDHVVAGDLVITADVPLADQVVHKQALALNPRGMLYDQNNIKAHLQRRDLAEQRRSCGIQTTGPKALGSKDIQNFANALDRYLRQVQL